MFLFQECFRNTAFCSQRNLQNHPPFQFVCLSLVWVMTSFVRDAIRGKFCSRSRTPSTSDCREKKKTVKSRKKASIKTVQRKIINQRKKRKTSSQPSAIQTKTWSPQKRDRFIFKFFALMFFNSSWPEMSFIDMMTNSLLEIWNLVWTKPQTGQATTKGFAIYIIVPGHSKSSPFSSARVSYEILSKESSPLFSMNL